MCPFPAFATQVAMPSGVAEALFMWRWCIPKVIAPRDGLQELP
jgi:hypothetical protein